MKKILLVIVVIILIAISSSYIDESTDLLQENNSLISISSEVEVNSQEVDVTAGFAIFTNGVFRVFTSSMYHNLSSEAYISRSEPNVIHVKVSGITWGEFFATLPLELTQACLVTGNKERYCSNDSAKLKFYINGVEDDNVLSREITQSDKLLITYGSKTEQQLKEELSKIPNVDKK